MFQSAHEDPTAEPWPWDKAALEGSDGKEHPAVTLLLLQTEFPQRDATIAKAFFLCLYHYHAGLKACPLFCTEFKGKIRPLSHRWKAYVHRLAPTWHCQTHTATGPLLPRALPSKTRLVLNLLDQWGDQQRKSAHSEGC